LPPRLIGRENELDDLRSYRRSVLATDGPWVPTYVLTGPGGAGKSALMSTFVLDERRGGGSGGEGPPVIYLDFDKAAVIDATPLELTFELTRQIGHVDEGLDRRLAGFRELGRELGRSFGADGVDSESGTEFNANRELASILSDWEHRDAPVLVVLDAFEELAGRGSSAVMLVLMWLRGLRDEVGLTQIHAIVSGREVVPDAPYLDPGEAESWFAAETKWELGDLDRADASELLRMLGVSDDLSERLPAVFGGNPLVIKLLARFVERSTQAEIEELIASSADEGAPVGEVGQRFVYRRILERVKNRQVRSLAYPGIALRRVTPELVLEVLAPHLPRTLAVTTLEEAKRVFDELAEHVWLVSRIDDITVVHRQDTRRLLVHGLQSDPDVPTAAIHRSAAEYYERGPDGVPDEVAQLEASYHRGFLGDVPVDRLEASRLLRRLGADLNFWPVEARALLKSNAGADEQLTEKELVSLSGRLLTKSRAARIQQRQMLGDIGGAAYEADRLAQVDELDESPERLNYLFGIGDFDYLTDDARARRMIEAYLVDGVGVSREPRTHHHPWLIATAYRILGKVPERILSEAVVDVIYDFDQRLYATAVAGLVGDEESQRAILPGLDNLVRRPVEGVDELLEYQAIGNLGFGNVPVENLLARSVGAFRFDCLAGVAGYATSSSLADVVERFEASFRSEQPTTSELNAYRKDLGAHELVFPDVRTLRSAPVLLSCLYAPLRTVALGLTAEDQRQIIDLLAIRSIFWPRDQTGAD
ncbi:MAG: ATP-binding protein, partial [Acidimicrobiales bacterium]